MQNFLGHLDQTPPFRPNVADDQRGGRIGAPAVELAGRVDLEQIAVAEHALAGDAVDHLLIHGQARGSRKRHFLSGITFEKRDGVVAMEKILDRPVDFNRADTGLGHLPDDAQGVSHQLAGLAHQAHFARRFQLRRSVTDHLNMNRFLASG